MGDKSQTQVQQPATMALETAMTTTANYCTLRRRASDLIKNKTKIEYISNVRLDFPSSGSSSSSSGSGSGVKTDQLQQAIEAASNTNSSTCKTPLSTTTGTASSTSTK